MVLKNNIEKTLRDLETRINELEQRNESLHSEFKYFEDDVREREEETKANIKDLEEKIQKREEDQKS
ncbi:11148_t:CDS:2 [Funneliformis geosporum]|uniref:11148_t:CDS:1 n=1 Tax=Funneliformis geosporum TaxID=1117311 RepID=A0A9W4SGN8_9GLOM|nr:11148_t:CDS:2 [Funneliformis geosporum]